jgi:hypothetical protein
MPPQGYGGMLNIKLKNEYFHLRYYNLSGMKIFVF